MHSRDGAGLDNYFLFISIFILVDFWNTELILITEIDFGEDGLSHVCLV